MSRLDVFLHETRIGALERVDQGALRFTYDTENASLETLPPLSLSLPPRAEPYGDSECRGFFSGLLPEGGFLRSVARAFGVSASNPFSVLEAIGGECAGAVSLAPPGSDPPPPRSPHWLDAAELFDLLENAPARALLAGVDGEGLRLSLAGAQEKLPVIFRGGTVGVTAGDPPSTHIIKLPIGRFLDTVANEAFCLALARDAGLDGVEATAQGASRTASFDRPEIPFLLVTRYDRSAAPQRRIHQEDFCQALGLAPELKYQADGGPGIEACAALISRHSAVPARDRLAFADALLFNFMIGNHDAHSKNYSLLLEGPDTPRMTPLYDLISTAVYDGLSRKLAMKYGGENRPAYIGGRHLDRTAAELGMRPPALRARALDLIERVETTLPGVQERTASDFADSATIDRVKARIESGSAQLRAAIASRA